MSLILSPCGRKAMSPLPCFQLQSPKSGKAAWEKTGCGCADYRDLWGRLRLAETTISTSFGACSGDFSREQRRLRSRAKATPVARQGDSGREPKRLQSRTKATPVARQGDSSREQRRLRSQKETTPAAKLREQDHAKWRSGEATKPNLRNFAFFTAPARHRMKRAHIRIRSATSP